MDNKDYKTNKLWLVASLLTYGIIHKNVEQKPNDFKKWFVYENTPDLMKAIALFYSGQLNVQAMQMEACYTQILEIAKSKEVGNG